MLSEITKNAANTTDTATNREIARPASFPKKTENNKTRIKDWVNSRNRVFGRHKTPLNTLSASRKETLVARNNHSGTIRSRIDENRMELAHFTDIQVELDIKARKFFKIVIQKSAFTNTKSS